MARTSADPKILVCLKWPDRTTPCTLRSMPFSELQRAYAPGLQPKDLRLGTRQTPRAVLVDCTIKHPSKLVTVLPQPVDPGRWYPRDGRSGSVHYSADLRRRMEVYWPHLPLDAQLFWNFAFFLYADNELRLCFRSLKTMATTHHARQRALRRGARICVYLGLVLFRSGKLQGEPDIFQFVEPAVDEVPLEDGRKGYAFPQRLLPRVEQVKKAMRERKEKIRDDKIAQLLGGR